MVREDTNHWDCEDTNIPARNNRNNYTKPSIGLYLHEPK